MRNLIRMDNYRMLRQGSVRVCLLLALVFALADTPVTVLLERLLAFTGEIPETKSVPLAAILGNPFPMVNAMLLFLAVCGYYYADIEGGFIKNIAGQMPKRGYAVLSKFLASGLLTLIFALAGILGELLGTLPFRTIVMNGNLGKCLGELVLRLFLAVSINAILLLCVSTLRIKSLGTTLAVLFGTGLTGLIYLGISSGVNRLLKTNISLADYMPDQLLNASHPGTAVSLISGAVTLALFLTLAIRIFDRRDVK